MSNEISLGFGLLIGQNKNLKMLFWTLKKTVVSYSLFSDIFKTYQ